MYNNEAGRLKPVWPNVGNKSCSIFTKVVLKEAIHVLLKNRPNSYKNWATFIKKICYQYRSNLGYIALNFLQLFSKNHF